MVCVKFGAGVVVMGSADTVSNKVLNDGFTAIPSNLESYVRALFGEALYGETTISAEAEKLLKEKVQASNAVIEEAEALKKEGLEAISTDDLAEIIQAEKANAEARKLEAYKNVDKTEAFTFSGKTEDLQVVWYKHTTKKGKTVAVKGLIYDYNLKAKQLSVIPADSEAVERFPKQSAVNFADVINFEPVKAYLIADLEAQQKLIA